MPLTRRELRSIKRRLAKRFPTNKTIETTKLLNEVYRLKELVDYYQNYLSNINHRYHYDDGSW